MNQPIHILNKLGVLTSFSVATKMTEKDIQKYFAKYKKSGKSESQIEKMLQNKILSDIENAIKNNEIPGLLSQQDIATSLGFDKKLVEKIPELNRLISILSQKIADKKYNKTDLCYFINALVNVLGLTEEDFLNFHKENNSTDGDNNGDDEDDEDGAID